MSFSTRHTPHKTMAGEFNSNSAGGVVVKIGGVALTQQPEFVDEIKTLYEKHPLIIVHGGGKLVSQWLGKLNIMPEFVNGLRRTDLPTLEVVTAILGGVVNINIVAEFKKVGVGAVGLSGVTLMRGAVTDDELGYVAETAEMLPHANQILGDLKGLLPIISPLVANSATGADEPPILNMNGDTFAGCLAGHLNVSKLIFITDTEGVLDKNKRRIPHITANQAAELVETGIAKGGMVPKIKACLTASASNPQIDTYIIGSDKAGVLSEAIQGAKVGTNIYRPKA